MRGSISEMSKDTYVNSLSFNKASMSTTMVSICGSVMNALASVFFMACLVNPIRRSQHVPYHGARFGIKCQVIFLCPRVSLSVSDSNNFCNSSAAVKYMDKLSDNIFLGSDFLLTNLLKASRKLSTVRSCTISKCTVLPLWMHM